MKNYVVFFSIAIIAFSSCGKIKEAIVEKAKTQQEQYFESEVLGRTFTVTLATDSGVDYTAQYAGYTFVMTKGTDLHNGPVAATKASATYAGTWTADDDYGKFNITLPSTPTPFVFMTRDWKFISKSLPTMKLAPWGTTEPKVMYLTRN